MAQKNHFQINRSLLDHPLWLEEPFTKGQAWVDLIGSANYKDGYFIKKGQRVDVKRGQSGTSMLTFAKKWRWSRGKVKRFFIFLEKERMIVQQNGHLTTLTTICNYDRYQLDPSDDGTTERTSGDTSNGHLTDIRRTSDGTHPIRTNNNQKEKNVPPNPPSESVAALDDGEGEGGAERLADVNETMSFQLDPKLKQAFDDAVVILGVSREQLGNLWNRWGDAEKLAEAIQCAVEIQEKKGVLDSPVGFINHACKEGAISLSTRKAKMKANPRINGKSKEDYLKILNESIKQPNEDAMFEHLKANDEKLFRVVNRVSPLLFDEKKSAFSVILRECGA